MSQQFNKNGRIHIILATDIKGGIAKEGKIPWNIKQEMAFFKRITQEVKAIGEKQNAVVMGRKTWDSLSKKPLPNRHNVVLTSSQINPHYDGVTWKSSLEDAFIWYLSKTPHEIEDLYIIGGEYVYDQCMKNWIDLIDSIYITEIDQDYQCDQCFSWFERDFIELGYELKSERIEEIDLLKLRYLHFVRPRKQI